jgi:Mce-associated membrane protein
LIAVRRLLVPLLALALVLGAGWLYWDASTRRAARHAGDDAARTAQDSIVAILSYQPATVQQSLEAAAHDRLTGTFLDDYTQLIKTVVVPEAVGKRITVSAKVPATAVVSADPHRAVLLAYVDQTTTTGSAAPTRSNSAVRVTMDNVDGRWLISGFDPM